MGVLEGKVAIVTGGSSGIGAAIAERFASEGARVVIATRRVAEGEATAARVGPNACFVLTHVADEADVSGLVAHALDRFGRLDCLVNNAGNPGHMVPIAETEIAHFDALMAVHVRGAMLAMKHAAPALLRQQSGSVINIASASGLRAGFSAHSYSAAKAALIHLTRSVAAELGEAGVRVEQHFSWSDPHRYLRQGRRPGGQRRRSHRRNGARGVHPPAARRAAATPPRPARRRRPGRAVPRQRRRRVRQRPGHCGGWRRRLGDPFSVGFRDRSEIAVQLAGG